VKVPIAVLDYGSGNLHSVSRAIAKVGGDALITNDAADVAAAGALVIPGVGNFGMCMRMLCAAGLDTCVRDHVERGRPLFGVCLGMQVLLDSSEEAGEPGFGLIEGSSKRLPAVVKVPHIGWNEVAWTSEHPYIKGIPSGTRYYFVHSFAAGLGATTIGVTDHGGEFASVIANERIFGTQFHPEKSGDAGLQIYENFVREVAA
jgi:imidazole glycerol-phosphate synthase subunit HisH